MTLMLRLLFLWGAVLLGGYAAGADELKEMAGRINFFGTQLYSRLATGERNLAFSPLSVARAMLMVASGAEGETAKEIFFTLGLSAESFALMPVISNGLPSGEGFTLQFANSLWFNQDSQIKQPFSEGLQKYFLASAEIAPFSTDPGRARDLVNFWARKKTGGMIAQLLPEGSIETDTRLVLCDAIFFKALWASPFKPQDTIVDEFQTPQKTVNVRMMQQTIAEAKYHKGTNFHALLLPYAGARYSMILVQPLAGTDLRPCEQSWGDHAQWFTGWSQRVDLSMPSFTAESAQSLKRALHLLGVEEVFTVNANLSLMSDEKLHVSDVFHSCKIEVDESGTKAAAATGAVVGLTSVAPQTAIRFRLNRPFMYFIRDEQSGLVLFVGRIVELPDVAPKVESKSPDITESGYGPWTFGMSRAEVESVTQAGPFRLEREGGLRTLHAPWEEFFDRRADFFFDGMDQLTEMRIWLCSDAKEDIARKDADKAEKFIAPLTGGKEVGLAVGLFADLAKLDKGRPQIVSREISNGPGKPRIRLSVMRHPELGFYVYLTYSAL